MTVTLYDQMAQLPAIREIRPDFETVPIWVQRGVLTRLDQTFQAFFRRCKLKEKPGYPRFKGKGQFESILINDLGKRPIIVAGEKRVKIPLLGKVKFNYDRPIAGIPKAIRIVLNKDKWYVTFACVDVPIKMLPKTGKEVGVDLGLLTFVATSDGVLYENPRIQREARIATERTQRTIARRKRGGYRRNQSRKIFAKKQAKLANLKRENHIKVARNLITQYDIIYVEKLNIKGLARSKLAESVNDAAWGNFLKWLRVKAESAGREVVEVNPRNTSKTCSNCGVVKETLTLGERVFHCTSCGFSLDRDVNAAINIKGLGIALRGAATPVRVRQGSAKSTRKTKRSGHTDSLGSLSG